MTGYVLRRLAQMLPVLLVASLGVWAMVYAVPGGPEGMILGENATPEEVAALRAQLALDQPIVDNTGKWLTGALSGDMGKSIFSHQPVAALIAERLPATLQLGLCSILVGLLLGMPVAIISAIRPGTWIDRLLSGWSALALGVPTLAGHPGDPAVRGGPAAAALGLGARAVLREPAGDAAQRGAAGDHAGHVRVRYIRALPARLAAGGTLGRRCVRTARAKGLPERQVIGSHALSNALLPFVTVVGLMTANFIGGAVVTEAVLTYPGLGRLLVQAISTRDYPAIDTFFVIMVIYMVANIVVDVIYAYIDPRIEYA